MIVFRLTQAEYASKLDGEGARKFGGRWNSKGKSLLYTGETRALCSTEVAVHSPLGMVPQNYVMVSIQIPKSAIIEILNPQSLPLSWNQYPPLPITQFIGDEFVEKGDNLVLKVPSATIDGEHNFLLNPLHYQMSIITIIDIKPFNLDSRLFIK
jgi:RES domain-containing protein